MSYKPNLAAFKKSENDSLPVTEIFYSVQGEGRFLGCPALFIRFKYCDLGCAWCDTRFTWDADKIEPGVHLPSKQIAEQAGALVTQSGSATNLVHVVFTGGEPMLYQYQLPSLIGALTSRGFQFFEIETNGVHVPSREMIESISWWNCSPKLSNSGIPAHKARVPAALATILATNKCDFKFVIQSTKDIDEIERIYMPPLPHDRIMLMPEGVSADTQLRVMNWLLVEARNRGYRVSPRLHILAWGNERGR